MSHSERCLSANRFGDGFDCICDPSPAYLAGYHAGLRRAQELARALIATVYVGSWHVVDFEEFDRAVEAESDRLKP